VSVLYNTVSTDGTFRHGDDTPIKFYVTQRLLLRFHSAFRYVKLRYGALRQVHDGAWVTMWVALCGLRCVGDDVDDGIWMLVTVCVSIHAGVRVQFRSR